MLQACLNGNRDKSYHAALPRSAEELARDARAVVDAGAQELHIHARDGTGRESLHPDDIGGALRAIRASVPGTPVGVSTGTWIAPTGRARHEHIRAWRVLPDYVSVNVIEEDSADVIALALDKGLGVEAGVWSVSDTERLVAFPTARRCLRILMEINEQDLTAALAAVQGIVAVLKRADIHLPCLMHGYEATIWPLYREALRLGFDARIGLEDGKLLPSGAEASGNAALVRAAGELMR
jgi:uncharacterized protein (DUF849 family)